VMIGVEDFCRLCYTVKKVDNFPVPGRDPGWGRENGKPFFTVYGSPIRAIMNQSSASFSNRLALPQ
jgi:hypothetical protein